MCNCYFCERNDILFRLRTDMPLISNRNDDIYSHALHSKGQSSSSRWVQHTEKSLFGVVRMIS